MRLNNLNNKKWFVLYNKPKHELKVKENLSSNGIESFCPTVYSDRIWSYRNKKVKEAIVKKRESSFITTREIIGSLRVDLESK